MGDIGSFEIILAVIIWFIPILMIVGSNKTSGREKLAWLIALFFISWMAWIVYLLIAPIKKIEA